MRLHANMPFFLNVAAYSNIQLSIEYNLFRIHNPRHNHAHNQTSFEMNLICAINVTLSSAADRFTTVSDTVVRAGNVTNLYNS